MNNYYQKIKKQFNTFLKDPLFLRYWEHPWHSQKKNDNQLSVFISGRRKRGIYQYYGHSSMFIEDMYVGIMPFMHYKGESEKYPTKIEPYSRENERLVADGLSNNSYPSFLGDELCDFVRTASHTLFQNGVAIYEIVYKKNNKGEIESFDLKSITPFYLFRFFNNYY